MNWRKDGWRKVLILVAALICGSSGRADADAEDGAARLAEPNIDQAEVGEMRVETYGFGPELFLFGSFGERSQGEVAERVQRFWREHGVELADGSFFYNDRTGELRVRADEQTLGTIERVLGDIQTLTATVRIELRFVEYRGNLAEKELWAIPGSSHGQGAHPGHLNIDWLKAALGEPDQEPEQEHPPNQKYKLWRLTEGETAKVLAALETREGVDVLTAPRVSTMSGRLARIQIENSGPPVLIPPFYAPGKEWQFRQRIFQSDRQ